MTATTVRRRVTGLLALVLAGALALTACSSSDEHEAHSRAIGPHVAQLDDDNPEAVVPQGDPQLPVTLTDHEGTQVTITDTSRIVAMDLYGTLTQTVYALGLGDRLVGRDIAAKFPAVESVPVVNPGGQSLNAEAILDLRPTVVLTDSSIGPRAVQDQLRATGVPVVFFDPERTLDGVEPQITAVAQALGVPDAGTALAAQTREQISQARSMAPTGGDPYRVAFVYSRGTALMMLGGRGSGADSLIEALGAEDAGVASGVDKKFVNVTSEAMIAAAPDVLLMMKGGLESLGGVDGLSKVPGLAQTPAGESKSVVSMDDGVLLGFGPNTGRVLQALAQALYGSES